MGTKDSRPESGKGNCLNFVGSRKPRRKQNEGQSKGKGRKNLPRLNPESYETPEKTHEHVKDWTPGFSPE